MKIKEYKMWMNTVTGETWASMVYTRKKWKKIKEAGGKPSQWKRAPYQLEDKIKHLYEEMEWKR